MMSELPDMSGVNEEVLGQCCRIAKSIRKSHISLKQSMARSALDRAYSAVVRPIAVLSFKRAKYFVTLLDGYKGYYKVR